jgi:hypothetical protein
MSRYLTLISAYSACLLLFHASGLAAQYGRAEEAKAMLKKAVVAVKAEETKALAMFNSGEREIGANSASCGGRGRIWAQIQEELSRRISW